MNIKQMIEKKKARINGKISKIQGAVDSLVADLQDENLSIFIDTDNSRDILNAAGKLQEIFGADKVKNVDANC